MRTKVYHIAGIFRGCGGVIFAVFVVGHRPRKFNPRINENSHPRTRPHAFCLGTRFHVLFDPHSAMSQAVYLIYSGIWRCSST